MILRYINPFFLAIISLLMAMNVDYRLVAYSLFFLYVVGTIFRKTVFGSSINSRVLNGNLGLIIALFLLLVVKDMVLGFLTGKGEDFVLVSFSNLIFCYAVLCAINSNNWREFFYIWSAVLYFFGLLIAVVNVLGDFIDIQQNYPSAMMVPLALFIMAERSKLKIGDWVLILTAIFFCIYTEARTPLAATIIGIFFAWLYKRNYRFAFKAAFISGFVILGFCQLYFAIDNTDYANQLLTNRPVIWNYYLDRGLDSPVFGSGPIDSDISEGAAKFYQEYIERGVAEKYGTQSMFFRYFVESGCFGLLVLFAFIFICYKKFNFGSVIFCTYIFVSFGESISIGVPSVYGLPILLGMIVSIREDERQKELVSRHDAS